jgi:hypothetical protein
MLPLASFRWLGGRLEGHVIGNLVTIMNLLGTSEARLPFRWDERLDLWKKGFSSVPSLQPHKGRAVELKPLRTGIMPLTRFGESSCQMPASRP